MFGLKVFVGLTVNKHVQLSVKLFFYFVHFLHVLPTGVCDKWKIKSTVSDEKKIPSDANWEPGVNACETGESN